MKQKRRSGQDEYDGAGDDDDPVPLKEVIEWSKAGKSNGRRLARRFERCQHRRHQRDTAKERDQHPATRNQAEFGKTAVAGRKKREEADSRRRRRKRQGRSRLSGGTM